MINFNIHFQFDNNAHVANVSYSPIAEHYTIYFTSVELILAFGNKAEYSRQKGMKFLKKGKDCNELMDALTRELQMHFKAA